MDSCVLVWKFKFQLSDKQKLIVWGTKEIRIDWLS
jgi:hypothetical protein